MPYVIELKPGTTTRWQVRNTETGQLHSKSTTKSKAEAQMRLLNSLHPGVGERRKIEMSPPTTPPPPRPAKMKKEFSPKPAPHSERESAFSKIKRDIDEIVSMYGEKGVGGQEKLDDIAAIKAVVKDEKLGKDYEVAALQYYKKKVTEVNKPRAARNLAVIEKAEAADTKSEAEETVKKFAKLLKSLIAPEGYYDYKIAKLPLSKKDSLGLYKLKIPIPQDKLDMSIVDKTIVLGNRRLGESFMLIEKTGNKYYLRLDEPEKFDTLAFAGRSYGMTEKEEHQFYDFEIATYYLENIDKFTKPIKLGGKTVPPKYDIVPDGNDIYLNMTEYWKKKEGVVDYEDRIFNE